MFLPITAEEVKERGWDGVDFVYVSGDAYVDHPSFGAAIITRVMEAEGYRVAFLSQPDWRKNDDFLRFGRPKLGFMVSSGNIDSMVAHYTAAKKHRSQDAYSPGKVMGLRPDRAVIVYCNKIRELYGDIPIIIGGLEASLRRFAPGRRAVARKRRRSGCLQCRLRKSRTRPGGRRCRRARAWRRRV